MGKRIFCSKCGVIKNYYIKKTVRVHEYFNAEGESIDYLENISEQYTGTLKKCPMCDRIIKIVP